MFVHYLHFSQEECVFSALITQLLLIPVLGYPICVSESQDGLRFFQTLKSLLASQFPFTHKHNLLEK